MGCRAVWLTGLSGAGKSTIARQVAEALESKGHRVLVLDGDAVRSTVSPNLGFSREDIYENNRRFIELCRESMPDYEFVLVPKISPFREHRAETRRELGSAFIEVYVQASLGEVARRDPKGLYKKAREGALTGMIGVAPEVPYEAPEDAEVVLDTETLTAEDCGKLLTDYLLGRERSD
ncbi:MAG: adenylyl-sulfate kinase [Planctomycetota bacterium]|jgi:adenylyl-sulfate kinase|nr:adenylyl-sulfate kinase [Planctomycetota bacterium]